MRGRGKERGRRGDKRAEKKREGRRWKQWPRRAKVIIFLMLTNRIYKYIYISFQSSTKIFFSPQKNTPLLSLILFCLSQLSSFYPLLTQSSLFASLISCLLLPLYLAFLNFLEPLLKNSLPQFDSTELCEVVSPLAD